MSKNICIDEIMLPKKNRLFLLDSFKSGNSNSIVFTDESMKAIFREYELVEINMEKDEKCFKLTDKGKIYCENEIKEERNQIIDSIIKWISLIMSVLAIIISIVSVVVQVASYRNEITENTKETTEIINEIDDNITNTDVGIR